MARKDADRPVRTAAPVPPIRVGGRARGADTHYDAWLTVFLRGVAALWMGEGLLQWFDVLTQPGGPLLGPVSPLHVSALFFFCVLDFVAAVGLWLVTNWGPAVWIATMLGHVLAVFLAPDFLPGPVATLVSDGVLIGVYAFLARLASRDERRRLAGA